MKFHFELLREQYAVCRLDPIAEIPRWVRGELVSITRTKEELSIVCQQSHVPADVAAQRQWRCLRVAGQLEFSLVGVIADLTGILAEAGISVFVMSTYDTDYLWVRDFELSRAIESLEQAGHHQKQHVECEGDVGGTEGTKKNP